MRDLAALPKAHLHLHLEAGMSPALLAELAAKYDREVPVVRGYGSFAAFSDTYVAATDVLREREDWERLADELCATHVTQGAVYVEPAFWAGNYRHRFASDQDCWELVFEVFDEAAARHGIAIGWMVPVDRVRDPIEDAVALAHFALANTDHVVSFGLHNDEVGHPPGDFVEPFRIAREGGLLITPHAGELARLLSARLREGRDRLEAHGSAPAGDGSDGSITRAQVEAEPLRWARIAHELTGATVLLKGAVTVVVGPQGAVYAQADGPAWLATAGAGDVLTGVLGALLAARATEVVEDPTLAAALAAAAALVHGRAAHHANPGGPVTALAVAAAVPVTVAGLLA